MSPLCFGSAKVVAFCDVTIQNGLNPSQNLFLHRLGKHVLWGTALQADRW